ncbi:spore coat U domain-containing protein [uncultured Ramlibacter sp.]|uniref:Csu type fimbrial protein n=1 Tax=uncultured Ramlibacter sp. TaxID=260755 RepID=UPI00260DFF5F|nr:spore coat U domain-containing protein [uncultured Ramlibacter sp.]
MMRRHLAVLLTLGLLPWTHVHAQQNTANTSFRVSARVNAVCDISASNLDFGVYSAQGASPLQGTTLLRATCTPNTSYQIGLNEGTSPGATVTQRKLASAAANVLNYQLYSDSARSTVWGNTPGSDTVTGTGTGLAQDHTVFGTIPAAQTVPSEEYVDTITVRIYY